MVAMSHRRHEKKIQTKATKEAKKFVGNRLGFGGSKLVLVGTNKRFGGKQIWFW